MSKRRIVALVCLTLIGLSSFTMQAVSAEAEVIPCEGDFLPAGLLQIGLWTYPGGNWHVRDMIGLYEQVMPTSDPRCSGSNTVFTNANWDAYGVGPSWGTFRVVPNDLSDYSGGWEGTWTGMTYADGTTSIRVQGHGYGDLEGQKVFVDIQFPGLFLPGTASGYILDPHGEQ